MLTLAILIGCTLLAMAFLSDPEHPTRLEQHDYTQGPRHDRWR